MTGRLYLNLNSSAAVEITVRRDFIELRHDGHCIAVIDRDQLRGWLTQPLGRRFPIDDVSFTHLQHGHVLLSISGAGVWTLTPATIKALVVRL
jgi:hypothetical protein